MRRLALALLLACHCAAPPKSAEPPPAPSAPAPAPPATAPPAPASPPSAKPKADVSPPPLATPNKLAEPKGDAGASPEPGSDPMRRIGRAAQDCHAKHAAGIAGKLHLRIKPDSSGAVASASVVVAASTKELLRPAFETCVLDAVKKEKLAPAHDAEDEIELPLSFEPNG